MTSDNKIKKKQEKEMNDDEVSGFATVMMVEFLYDQIPELDRNKLLSVLEQHTGTLKFSEEGKEIPSPFAMDFSATGEDGLPPQVFFHMDHKVTFEDGVVPAQSVIHAPQPIRDFKRFDSALQQSWHWPEAKQTVNSCTYSIRAHDLFAANLPYKERFELILGLVMAIVEAAPCKAIYWHTSDKLVAPTAYVEAIELDEKLYGAVNLRLFNTGDTEPKEMIMDTLGLSALGIPDVQCHFSDMDPTEIARNLLLISKYLYDQGDIVKNGETIGTSANKGYLCEHQQALVIPARYVLDLNPSIAQEAKITD
ncbi:DUF4261 domain-containing protein [Paenibacillus sp. IHBB 10380]|uniref:DUF4261 domain-containing protein n=1 Tax=Paenibacillus sp. IHBB 10380 TaxID=1566358 RepID=UPI0005CFC62F|nr:DUF4261 domain-containing protein [Paenibacillus sp. IHBB 10380]AJS59469.1 hypothetical protein UB51_14485 [Paenibacillus sp. IHBB 10380]